MNTAQHRMRPIISRLLFFVPLLLVHVSPVAAQSPEIFKVDPPSWWVQSSMNPVRLLIRGRNLQGARLQPLGRGLRVVGQPKVNPSGTYIFADLAIAPNAMPGQRRLRVTTPGGSAEASFDVLRPLNRAGRFQGFSPDD